MPASRARRVSTNQLRLDFERVIVVPRAGESLEEALESTFPERDLTDPEKIAELNRLFHSTAITPENPITDADVPF